MSEERERVRGEMNPPEGFKVYLDASTNWGFEPARSTIRWFRRYRVAEAYAEELLGDLLEECEAVVTCTHQLAIRTLFG